MGARARAGSNIVWLLVIGSGIGWLVGISLSPVLQVVVGSVIASVAALVGVVSGVSLIPKPEQNESDSSGNVTRESRSTLRHSLRYGALQVDALPLGIVVAGLWVGSSFGIYARTNDWLGPNPHRIASKWATSGLSEADIQKQVFNQLYPPVATEPAKDRPAPNPALACWVICFFTERLPIRARQERNRVGRPS